MSYVGSVSLLVNGRLVTVPVSRVTYENVDEFRPAGGVAEGKDGSLQIIIDARLSEEAAARSLENSVAEISRRLVTRVLN